MTTENNTLDLNETDSNGSFNFDSKPIKGLATLQWRGKRPFTSTRYYPAQLKEQHGEAVNGWLNKIFWGDNLQVMSHLLREFRGKVDLIYIDPPFDSKADYKKKINLKGAKISNDQSTFEEKQYTDIWSNDEYLQFMFERLMIMRELLSDQGTIYLHCDSKKAHYLHCILDQIFGVENFINEITWHYYNKMAPDSKCFPRASDKILAYSKYPNKHIFYKQVEKRDKPVKQLVRKFVDGKAINARDEDGNVMYRMTDEKRVDDVWRIAMLQPADNKEPTGYPTQKPEVLLQRIIQASSNKDSIIFDCFMGSGTTQAVAMKLGRRFIGADINLGAIQTTTKRLIKVAKELKGVQPELGEEKELYTGFEVYNVNHYDVFRNPVQAKELLIQALDIQPIPNNVYDGEKDGRMVKLMPVNHIATKEDVADLIHGVDYKVFEKRREEKPNQPVEKITIFCMGHEPDLAAFVEQSIGYKLDIEVVDILRDRSDLQFKRDSEALFKVEDSNLAVDKFYPMNLLQKLSQTKDTVSDWREMVESIMIDWNYDGAVFQPTLTDIPAKNELVQGQYAIPEDAGTIRIKITDLLSESLERDLTEEELANG